VLVRGVALGVCGTDRDIIAGAYGSPPPGHQRLIIGHESLGRIEHAPEASKLKQGDLVVGIVRHPDPIPCANCAAGEWDMCANGEYTEHGIKSLDGFGAEFYRLQQRFVVPVDASLGALGVLVEPTTIVAKAWEQIDRIQSRLLWHAERVLVTGAGPVGLLAAMIATQRGLQVHIVDHNEDGIKPELSRALGASYHTNVDDAKGNFDAVIECTGVPSVITSVLAKTGINGVVCLTGVSNPGAMTAIDIGAWNRDVVLGNRVVFGSVNANRRHYEAAIAALGAAKRDWLERLVTRHVPLDDWQSAFEQSHDDIKTVIDL
jgi:threonine dehydrogenase-like Zn-dependent dehydrogenase